MMNIIPTFTTEMSVYRSSHILNIPNYRSLQCKNLPIYRSFIIFAP